MNTRSIIALIAALSLFGCTREQDVQDTSIAPVEASLELTIGARAALDPQAVANDQTFSSLAIYIFDENAGGVLEQAALLPSFSAVGSKIIPFKTQPGTKAVYILANYVGKTLRRTSGAIFVPTASATKAELEDLIVENSTALTPGSLFMVGKGGVVLNSGSALQTVAVELRRLQSRVDVHVRKGANFGAAAVTLKSLTLYQRVLNSEVKYDYLSVSPSMLASAVFDNPVVNSGALLSTYVPGEVLVPSSAQAVFYSFQNLVTSFSPLQSTAPRLQAIVTVDGVDRTYSAYITDNNQTSGKYSLQQNNVYQVTAILDVDSKIVLNVSVLPWNQTSIEYDRPITSSDFVFAPWNSSWGGTNAKVMNTNVGALEDAVYSFELKSPFGASWVATLTNGLDFAFASSSASVVGPTVSSGFTNTGTPASIAIRASKRWTGDARQTEFYITVQGREIPINPVVGRARLYPGTLTRIIVTQVASYN